MDQVLVQLSSYSRGANEKLVAALDALSTEALEADRGSYYKSLHGLFSHLVNGELFTIKFLKTTLPGHPALAAPQTETELSPGEPAFPLYEDARRALAAFDAAYAGLAATLAPEELEKTVSVYGRDIKVAYLLTSAVCHVAHHRGQIAQVLDELGIENDFYMAMRGC
jgi:uncharacterized damage-inducible protein DinB